MFVSCWVGIRISWLYLLYSTVPKFNCWNHGNFNCDERLTWRLERERGDVSLDDKHFCPARSVGIARFLGFSLRTGVFVLISRKFLELQLTTLGNLKHAELLLSVTLEIAVTGSGGLNQMLFNVGGLKCYDVKAGGWRAARLSALLCSLAGSHFLREKRELIG